MSTQRIKEITRKIWGGKDHWPEAFPYKGYRQWRADVANVKQQCRREVLKREYQKVLDQRTLPRETYLKEMYKKRIRYLVELENERMASYRKFNMDNEAVRIRGDHEDFKQQQAEKFENETKQQLLDRIKRFQDDGFVTHENLDEKVDAAMDNPEGFGSPLMRSGQVMRRRGQATTTTTTSTVSEDDGLDEVLDEDDDSTRDA